MATSATANAKPFYDSSKKVKMFKDKYAKKAHEITQNYIETYGAHFANIDELDKAIASAIREAVEHSVQSDTCPHCGKIRKPIDISDEDYFCQRQGMCR